MQSRRSSSLALTVVLLLLGSCATYEAVVAAPPEFWMSMEEIFLALIQDVWSVVELAL